MEDQLSIMQMTIVVMIQICESININVLFPFLAFMVEDFGYEGHQLGVYAGMLAATFCGAQLLSSIAWGQISDRYGRRPATILGTFGAGLGMLVFGLSTQYYQAIIGRAISGLLSGNLGVVKCFLTEITTEKNRAAAYSYLSLGSSIGTVVGPLFGGLLSRPAVKYPGIFSPTGIFAQRPYLLPCLACVVCNTFTVILCLLYMVESRDFAHGAKPLSSSQTMDTRISDTPVSSKETTSYAKLDSMTAEEDESLHGSSPVTVVTSPSQATLSRDKTRKEIEMVSMHPAEEGENVDEEEEEEEEPCDVWCGVFGRQRGDENDEAHVSLVASTAGSGGGYDVTGPGFAMTVSEQESAAGEDSVISVSDLNDLSALSAYDIEACMEPSAPTTVPVAAEESPVVRYRCRRKTEVPVLQQRTVIMVTGAYGMLAMAAILLDETIPLLLKLDRHQGGFSFNSSQIGVLLSVSGLCMVFFAVFFVSTLARQSKRWLFRCGALGSIPVAFLWPLIALANHHFIETQGSFPWLWPCLMITYITKCILSTVCFTGVLMQVNHSVYNEYLGSVNGLGQTFASLARAIGPAVGGCLWSLSTRLQFVFLNFIVVGIIFYASDVLDAALPKRLEHQKKRKRKSTDEEDTAVVFPTEGMHG